MLDNYQILKENDIPKFAVVDYNELIKVQELLRDTEKLEDYLDYLHIQKIKTENTEYFSFDEIEKMAYQ